jgi:hypothetical protein
MRHQVHDYITLAKLWRRINVLTVFHPKILSLTILKVLSGVSFSLQCPPIGRQLHVVAFF